MRGRVSMFTAVILGFLIVQASSGTVQAHLTSVIRLPATIWKSVQRSVAVLPNDRDVECLYIGPWVIPCEHRATQP